MKKAIVIFANGFEEIEAATPVDVLRRCGVAVTAAGLGGTEIAGARGMRFHVDATLEEAAAGDCDLVVLPGGMPGAKNIGESALARDLVARMLSAGKLVAAICAAPAVTLAPWGFLAGRRATCYPGMETAFPADATFVAERVAEDGNLITSRGPGTALEFSLRLAARLAGAETAERVGAAMICGLSNY